MKIDITKRFTFELRLETSLTIDDIWPDGDAPEGPTAEDVLAQLKKSGSDCLSATSDWNLAQDATLTIIKASDWDDRAEWSN